MRSSTFFVCVLVVGCGTTSMTDDAAVTSDAAGTPDAAVIDDAAPAIDAASPTDGGASVLAACPTTGRGAIVAPAGCFVFSPSQVGSDASGDNATANHYALEPSGTARGELVLFLNASLATPEVQIADPSTNLYSTLAADGFHVLALAYRSTAIVGTMCRNAPSCFGPTRETLVRGTFTTGAATQLSDIREDEGILFRLDAALAALARERSSEGWSAFVDASGSTPDARIVWSHVSATGHSQGGGHAAYLGRLFPLRRVVQLSSTCDEVSGTPAPWTSATEAWATAPSSAFYGLAAATTFTAAGAPSGGDTTCPYHVAIWTNMGMDASHEHDDVETCTGVTPHSAVVQCPVNAPRWAPLFE